ncbi:MAG: tetratricopeptide repeat protein [Thermoplasmata archaeon]|nr:MAG: tetratricopeptide repeat protein [Thermoplasmata archaeon]
MTEAKEHLEYSLTGNGRLVFIVGETGVGKTRLMEELGTYAESIGVLCLEGKCLHGESAEPYLPFIQAFYGPISDNQDIMDMDIRLQIGGFSDKPDSLGLIPLAYDITRESIEGRGPNIKEERERLFESLYNSVIEISEKRPLLLVLDDLQWADESTLKLLHYLARNIHGTKVLICGAYRPEDLNSKGKKRSYLPETLKRMRIEKLFHEIALDRMNEEQTRHMIEWLLGKKELPREFTKKLYEDCDGNPYFVEEVMKSLVKEGLIDVDSYRREPKIDTSQIRLPKTVKDVIARRIDRLDEKTKNTLKYISVFGNSFSFELLHRIIDTSEEELIDAIDAAIAADIICEDLTSKEEKYKFDHTLIREVIYNSMSSSRRRLMHDKIGCAMEELYMDKTNEVVYNLVHHFYEGKDTKKTLLYAIMAGSKAANSYAPEDAIGYYRMAVEALIVMEDSDENQAMKLAVVAKLGDIYSILGEWDTSLRYHSCALELSRALKDELAMARTFRNIGHLEQNLGDYDMALEHFDSGLKISERVGDLHGMADTYRGSGRVFWRKGEFDKAIEHFEKSLQITQGIRDERVMAATCIELGNVYSELSDWSRAIDYQINSLKLLEKHEDFYEMGRNYNNIGVTYARKGDMKKAIENYEKSIELSNKTGNVRMVGWALFNAGEAYARTGNFGRALDCCEKSLSIFERLDEKLGISGAYMSYGIIYKLRKKWDEAIQYFEESVRIREELDMPYRLADGYFEFGLLYKEKGDIEKARELLTKALEIFSNLGAKELCKKAEDELKSINGMKSFKGN